MLQTATETWNSKSMHEHGMNVKITFKKLTLCLCYRLTFSSGSMIRGGVELLRDDSTPSRIIDPEEDHPVRSPSLNKHLG